MKALATILGLALVAPAYAVEVPAQPADGDAVVVSVTADDDGNVQKDVRVIRFNDGEMVLSDEAPTGHAVFVRAISDDEDASDSPHEMRFITRVNATTDSNRGWLGVALSRTDSADGTSDSSTVVSVVERVISAQK